MMETTGTSNFHIIQDPAQFKNLKNHEIGLTVLGLEHGFTAPDLAVLTEQDILGDRLDAEERKEEKRPTTSCARSPALDEGDLVTHIEHGIGKFIELETVTELPQDHIA